MARYGKKFKDRAVARLLPPEGADPQVVARELGVSASTLERWRSEALGSGEVRPRWTAAARFEAVLATAGLSEEQRSAWCRQKGIFPTDLDQWRSAARHALEEPGEREDAEGGAQRRRIRELERELTRKEKALAETAALLVLSKKVEAIFRGDEDG